MQFRRITLFVALYPFVVPTVFGQADAESRASQIRSAREKKSKELKPTPLPHGEAVYRQITESDLVGRILGGGIGAGARLGGLPNGSGFSAGPRYYRPDLAGENVVFSAWAVASFSKFYQIETSLKLPHLLHDRLGMEWKAFRNDFPAIEYYGSGPDSKKENRTSFRRESVDFSFAAAYRPIRRHVGLGFEAGATVLNIGPGTRENVPSADQVFSPVQSPGIDRQTNFARVGPTVTIDFRDMPLDPHKGTFFQSKYLFYKALSLEQFSFQKLTGVLEHYVPFLNEKRVIAVRAQTEWNLTDRRHVVPFYMQAVLGGSDDLRGYRRFRFYDDNAVALSTEYRWEVMPALDMAVFGDVGEVFSKRNHFAVDDMRGAAGLGFRIKARSAVVMRLDAALSAEGFQIWFKFGHAF